MTTITQSTDVSLPTVRSIKRSITRHIPTAARWLLGLAFLVFGLNGFLNFLPAPTEAIPDDAMAFFGGLMKTGYMFPLIKGTEVAVGLALVTNRFVPLSLVVLAPVMVNIVLVHAFLVSSGTGIVLVLLALTLYLAWVHRAAYRPLLAFRASR
ncbi:MAG TPA: hypothetical protein VIU61_26805 [Kofleriaceae bacterium]